MNTCPWCGPYKPAVSDTLSLCPRCKLTPGEHAYIDRILADSAGVYAEEHRAHQAERRAS